MQEMNEQEPVRKTRKDICHQEYHLDDIAEWGFIGQNTRRAVTQAYSDWADANGGDTDIFGNEMENE